MPTDASSESLPLVSIICRTVGREELKQALDSLLSQSHKKLELILIDAACKGISENDIQCAHISLKLVSPEKPLSRSQAANAGLEAASGEFLMFLDDDDWIAQAHIDNLLQYLLSHTEIKAAYSSTQKTDQQGVATDYRFEQDFDPLLLMRDNYIPIHSMLFHRSLLEQGCRFDDAFDIYEDWDFWLQLSRHTLFHHLNVVSAFYRGGGDSQTATSNELLRFESGNLLGDARSAIFNKWMHLWQGNELNKLIGQLYKDRVEEYSHLSTEIKARDKLIYTLQEKLADLETENASLRKERELRTQLAHQILELQAHIKRVEQAHRLIENSIFWRITAPLRNLRDTLFGKNKGAGIDSSSVEDSNASMPSPAGEPGPNSDTRQRQNKLEYDKKAQKKLDAFLTSSEKLILPAADNPTVSIILVLYNQAHLSFLCIQSVLEFAGTCFELVIVNNNSTDKTSKLLKRIENAKLIENNDNMGFVKAVNQGAAVASGEYILLLNNDALLEQDSIDHALSTIAKDSTIGAVGAKIKLLDGSLQEAGSIIFKDGSCHGYGRNEPAHKAEYNFQRDVDYCSGAFLLFSKSDFEKLDGFDEVFSPAYYEESDFCIRLQQQGKRIVYCPKAQITHYEFASSGGFDSASELQIAHREILLGKHTDYLANKFSNDDESLLRARTANAYPNVLIIDDRVPYPQLGAGYPRCSHILKELATLELNISFYPLQFPDDNWATLNQAIPENVEVILDRGVTEIKSFLEQRAGFFDFIMVSRIHNMECFARVLEQNPEILDSARLFYDAEAVSSPREVLKRRLLGETVSEFESQSLLNKEVAHSRKANKIIVVSDSEAQIYKDHGYENTLVLGHALSVKVSKKSFEQRNGILFVGALRDEGSPNVDSLLWFIINVLPIIEKRIPDIVLNVVGGNSASSLASIGKSNIHFSGELESIDEMYNSNRIFIAPTRFAAGIPHKIHEASANGLPTVATNLLAEQLSWLHNEQLLAANTEQEFAEQCIKLYSDKKCWEKLRSGAITAVEKDCSEEDFRQKLAKLFVVKA